MRNNHHNHLGPDPPTLFRNEAGHGIQCPADLVNAIRKRIQCLQFLRDLLQEIFDSVETAGDVVISAGHGFAELWCPAAA